MISMNTNGGLSQDAILSIYFAASTMIVLVCWWYIRSRDPSRSMPPPLLTAKLDPYEIAYMRTGENELTRVITVALAERGYLHATDKGIEQKRADLPALIGVEKAVCDFFSASRTGDEVFVSDLPRRVRSFYLLNEEGFQHERLVSNDHYRNLGMNVFACAGLVIVAVGIGVWLDVSVSFFSFMLMVSFLITFLHAVCIPGRLSKRGELYLAQLKSKLSSLRAESATPFALIAAVLGMSALAGTAFEVFAKTYGKTASSSGDCGCGGGGCGGGCGGCGG